MATTPSADYMDDDFNGAPIRLAVTLRVRGDEIELDYTGTDPQVNGALNLPAFGARHPFLSARADQLSAQRGSAHPAHGRHRAARSGSLLPRARVVNPTFPAAVGVRYATVVRLYNVVLGALAQAVPERVPAAGSGAGGDGRPLGAGRDDGETRRERAGADVRRGGATRPRDGPAAIDSAAGFLKNTPVESMEAHIPVLTERYELRTDSAGPGRHRGGWGSGSISVFSGRSRS